MSSMGRRVARRALFVLLGVSLLLIQALVAVVPSASARPGVSVAGLVASEADTEAMTLRSELGLESDLQYVQEVAASPSATTTLMGIPLAPSEQSEIMRRKLLGSNIHAIDLAFASTPTYGGSWIDNQAGGTLNVAFAGAAPSDVMTKLASLLTVGQSAQIDKVSTSLTQLNAALAQITSLDWPTYGLVSVAPDLPNSALDIKLSASAPSDAEASLRADVTVPLIVSRYGAGQGVQAASTRNFNSGELFGGGWLSDGTNPVCTDGYSNVRDSIGQYFTVTAGHCYTNGTYVYQGYDSGTNYARLIGNASSVGAGPNFTSNCDCEAVGLIPAYTGTSRVYTNNNALTLMRQVTFPYTGETYCQTGATSYEHNNGTVECGIVTGPGSAVTYTVGGGPYKLTDCVMAAIIIRPGDSGGTSYDFGNLLGINAATSIPAGTGYFSEALNFGTVHLVPGFSNN